MEKMKFIDIPFSDARVRGKNFDSPQDQIQPIHKSTTIEEFILEAHNPKTCGNLLDLQNLRPEAPTWIR
jgi:hypothetical protein